ncbi:hypothetical protein K440DRAFT_614026, partial [Wilcoxina mikolae CBS 423.85]
RSPRLCSLPLTVILKVLDHVDFNSLLTISRLSKRYNMLITNSRKRELFLIGPSPPPPPHLAHTSQPEEAPTAINRIHPIFYQLYFTPTNPVTAIRIGSGRGPLLGSLRAKNAFATEPAMCELCIRIIGPGKSGKVWDAECTIKKATGITVWDLVKQLTGFLAQDADPLVSFGTWFGYEYCYRMGLDPEVVMANHEFLLEKRPFPRLWVVNPENRTQIVCDYGLSSWAMEQLALTFPGPQAMGTRGLHSAVVSEALARGQHSKIERQMVDLPKDESRHQPRQNNNPSVIPVGVGQEGDDDWNIVSEEAAAPIRDVEAVDAAESKSVAGPWAQWKGDSNESKQMWHAWLEKTKQTPRK